MRRAQIIEIMTMISTPSNLNKIAKAFTEARLNNAGLPEYPGEVPQSLDEAYAIQDAAITLWPHKVAGWKIGGFGGDYAVRFKETKLSGPVFDNQIYKSNGISLDMPVFAEGFAAIEPEIVMIVKADAPVDKTNWTLDEAQEYVGAVHIGVEIASSPFPSINDMGPLVTISDFGNNNGLIIGQELKGWSESKLEDWRVETLIDGMSVGATTPPGPLLSFRFVLENTARRGMPLKKGMAITTGAITGVHRAFSGQSSIIKCSGAADINMLLVPSQ